MNTFKYYPRLVVLKMIKLYQKTLSFDHSRLRHLFPNGFCQFHPSCSEYGFQAISKYGLLKGGWMTIGRIVRCNPFSNGGIDEVPNEKTP